MNTKTLMKSCLLMLVLTLMSPQSVMASKNIPVINKNGNGTSKEQYPHRSPIPSATEIYGVQDPSQATLTLAFRIENPNVNIILYKDDTMVFSTSTAVCIGDQIMIDLSNYTVGQYSIVVMCEGEEEYIGEMAIK